MRLFIPLKYKIVFPVLVAVIASGGLFYTVAKRTLEIESSRLGLALSQSASESRRAEVEILLKLRLFELEKLRLETGFFSKCSEDFRNEVVGITVYTPNRDGTFSAYYSSNTDLLKKKALPINTLALIQKDSPVDTAALAQKREPVLLNRSVTLPSGVSLGVYSFVAYGKSLDGHPTPTVIVADALQDFFATAFSSPGQPLSYLVSESGNLIAHPDPEKLVAFKTTPFPGFPSDRMPQDWTAGINFEWGKEGERTLVSVLPFGIKGSYLYSEYQSDTLFPLLAKMRRETLLGLYAVLGLCFAVTFWLTRHLVTNIRNTAAVIDGVVRGEIHRTPEVKGKDEFNYVTQAFDRLFPSLQLQLKREFERGQKDSELAMLQAVRALVSTPQTGFFENWDFAANRPSGNADHQDIWEFNALGNRRQIILGRSSQPGVSGTLLAILVRLTLDSVKSRSFTLVQTLEFLNTALYAVFKGRVTFTATAFEVDLVGGAFACVTAGSDGPIRWEKQNGDPSGTVNSRTLKSNNDPIGSAPKANYEQVGGVLSLGECLLISASTLANPAADAKSAFRLEDLLQQSKIKQVGELKGAFTEGFNQTTVYVALGRPNQAVEESLRSAA
jgi:HAMP domain-containing protein